jgi:hypothetical protein
LKQLLPWWKSVGGFTSQEKKMMQKAVKKIYFFMSAPEKCF